MSAASTVQVLRKMEFIIMHQAKVSYYIFQQQVPSEENS